MKLTRFYLTFIFTVLLITVGHAQQMISHGHADTMVTVSFSQISTAPDTNKIPEEADDEEEMALPHDLPVPKGAKIQYEDPNVPNFNGGNQNGPAPMSPAPSTNFIGLVDNQHYIPPDVNGAAGPNHLMITLNSQVTIMNKSGTTVSGPVTLYNFWTTGGLSITSAFDPKVEYDQYSGRWIVVAFADPQLTTTSMLVAVSVTSDPTGSWHFYKIKADSTGTKWMDYPSIGFNKNWIVVNGNMYSISGNSFKGTKVYMLNKSNFYSGGTGTFTVVYDSTIGGTIAPATTYDSTVTTEYLIGNWNSTSGYIRLYKITGSVGSETFAPVAYINTTNFWGSGGAAGWDIAPQSGSSHKIAVNDDRIHKVVYRNGNIWCVHNAYYPYASPTRSSIQWWEVSTTGSVLQRGLIDDATGTKFYAFPSIAVNANNDALIGYCSFSSSQYASSDYSFRASCDASNTLETDYLYKAGLATYYKTYGGSNNRWGDYSGTTVDPANDLDMWTIQEYAYTHAASDSSLWSTWWAKVARTDGGSGTWTWTGSISTDWFNRCNWDKLTLPDASSDVVIPNTTNKPTISGATANCNSLSIDDDNGALLTITSTGAINVTQ